MDDSQPHANRPPELAFPPSLGRYTLLKRLAVGGMAEIFLARQQGMGGFEKILVVKKILDSYASDPTFVSLFLNEARVAAQLNHPNVVQIFDIGQEGATYFIAMEYLAGESLSRVVRRSQARSQTVPIHLAAQIVAQASDGLHYAHTATDPLGKPLGIVHRDVSPQNLLVTYGGGVKVVDFGIALAANRVSLTGQGQVRGKLAYMSPEQVAGEAIDGRADVFALGVILFETLTGTRLFSEDPMRTLAQILEEKPLPRASSRNPQVPFDLDEIVASALRKKMGERYQSAKELHDALEDWLRRTDLDQRQRLSEYMDELFAEERVLRTKLIDQAARGEELTVDQGVALDSNPSMPGHSLSNALPARPRLGQGAWLGIGGAALLAIAGASWVWWPRAHPPAPTAALPAAAETSLSVSGIPPEAHVIVDGTDRGRSPVHVSGLKLGSHAVTLHLEGRADVTRPLQFDRPGQSVDLVLEMAAAPAPATPPSPRPEPPSASAAPERQRPGKPPRKKGTEIAASGPSGSPGASRTGKLNLDSTPWSEVTIDGKKVGETPLIGVELPAGAHTVLLVNDDRALKKTISVMVTPGQTTAQMVKF